MIGKNKVILITGGTKGIGLGVVRVFAKLGAKVYATYAWGDSLPQVESEFANYSLPPTFIQANISQEKDTVDLMGKIKEHSSHIDVFIHTVALAPIFRGEYKYKDLESCIKHSAWPLVSYTDIIKDTFNSYPHYIIALTSEGINTYLGTYDYVAATKSLMETLIKYIAARGNIRINALSPSWVDTEALELLFGKEFRDFMKIHAPKLWTTPEEIANVCVALTSGLMDSVSGQIIKVDKGQFFTDNIFEWYVNSKKSESGAPTFKSFYSSDT